MTNRYYPMVWLLAGAVLSFSLMMGCSRIFVTHSFELSAKDVQEAEVVMAQALENKIIEEGGEVESIAITHLSPIADTRDQVKVDYEVIYQLPASAEEPAAYVVYAATTQLKAEKAMKDEPIIWSVKQQAQTDYALYFVETEVMADLQP